MYVSCAPQTDEIRFECVHLSERLVILVAGFIVPCRDQVDARQIGPQSVKREDGKSHDSLF